MGQSEPVTGRHSVMLSLSNLAGATSAVFGRAYPDSVRRVKPPNTTMPKTLAALPSSQYATLLDVVLGKLLDLLLPSAVVAASAKMALPALDPSSVALLRRGWVDFHLTDCRTEEDRDEDRGAEMADRIGELRHGLHTNRRRERCGAAVRSCGRLENIEAITATCDYVEKKTASDHVIDFGSSVAFRWFHGPAACQARTLRLSVDRRKRRPTPQVGCPRLHHRTLAE